VSTKWVQPLRAQLALAIPEWSSPAHMPTLKCAPAAIGVRLLLHSIADHTNVSFNIDSALTASHGNLYAAVLQEQFQQQLLVAGMYRHQSATLEAQCNEHPLLRNLALLTT